MFDCVYHYTPDVRFVKTKVCRFKAKTNKSGRGKPLPYGIVISAFVPVGAGLAPPASCILIYWRFSFLRKNRYVIVK